MAKATPAKSVALGGILAALAVTVMSMGTLIPVATYVCPMLCVIVLQIVVRLCGARIAWAWYGAVAILSLLLAPDKEAAAVFLCIGYYPIVKPRLDRTKGKWVWKGLLFNTAILLNYWILMHVLGMDALTAEFEELGAVMCGLLLVLGNVTFFLLDRILEMRVRRKR